MGGGVHVSARKLGGKFAATSIERRTPFGGLNGQRNAQPDWEVRIIVPQVIGQNQKLT